MSDRGMRQLQKMDAPRVGLGAALLLSASVLWLVLDPSDNQPVDWLAYLGLAAGGAMAMFWLSRRKERGALAPVAAPAPSDTAPTPAPAVRPLTDLRPFLEALPEAAMLVDQDGRILTANAAARRTLQFDSTGLRLSTILRQPDVLEAAEAVARDGATRTVDYETGLQVAEFFRVYVSPVAWGQERAALLIFSDQTAQVQSERTRADFLANASHELKTPVTALSLLVETLSGPARDDVEARDRFLALMQTQILRMRRLIEDLLSLSKIEQDEHVPPVELTNFAQVVREAVDGLSPVAREKGVTLRLEAPEAIPAIHGDRFQLGQVAQNLIDNAIKYSQAGGEVQIEISTGLDRESVSQIAGRRWPSAGRIALLTGPQRVNPGGFVFMRVSDAGPGIERRSLPRLSERFFRVERDTEAPKPGTGLGLAIVRHIVNRHRGGLLVESEPGRGSAFSIYLPAASAPALAAAE